MKEPQLKILTLDDAFHVLAHFRPETRIWLSDLQDPTGVMAYCVGDSAVQYRVGCSWPILKRWAIIVTHRS